MALSDYELAGRADLSAAEFRKILQSAASPAAPEAEAMWAALAQIGVRPAAFLAFFREEGNFGLAGIQPKYGTKNPGNVRAPERPALAKGSVTDPNRGTFAVYASWELGTADWAYRLRGPKYEGAGLHTVRQVLPKYAPQADGNSPDAYVRHVLAAIDQWVTTGATGMSIAAPTLIPHPSPNRNGYGGKRRVEALVWHISGGSDQSGIDWLCNPASKASCNYFNTRPGLIHELVPYTEDAWTNGIADHPNEGEALIRKWQAEGVNFNQRTIGIENGGQTSGNRGGSLTPQQIDALIHLSAWLCQENGIVPGQDTILGHYEIDSINRPYCPGFSAAEWADWTNRVVALWKGGVTPPPVRSDRNQVLIDEAIRLKAVNTRAIGVVQYASQVDLRGLRDDLPHPEDTLALVCEKEVLWYDEKNSFVDAFHRGQYESLYTSGKANERR